MEALIAVISVVVTAFAGAIGALYRETRMLRHNEALCRVELAGVKMELRLVRRALARHRVSSEKQLATHGTQLNAIQATLGDPPPAKPNGGAHPGPADTTKGGPTT